MKKLMNFQNRGLKKYIKCCTIALLLVIGAINAEATEKRITSSNGVNMRKLYNVQSDIVRKIGYGAKVNEIGVIITGFEKWSRVEYDGAEGYIRSDLLEDAATTITDDDGVDDGLSYLGNYHMTAYTHTGSSCANGNYPTPGYTVACNSLPFGTQIYIEGIGYRTVEDRGPASLGSNWCDVFYDSLSECVNFGSQYRDVYLVSEVNDDN